MDHSARFLSKYVSVYPLLVLNSSLKLIFFFLFLELDFELIFSFLYLTDVARNLVLIQTSIHHLSNVWRWKISTFEQLYLISWYQIAWVRFLTSLRACWIFIWHAHLNALIYQLFLNALNYFIFLLYLLFMIQFHLLYLKDLVTACLLKMLNSFIKIEKKLNKFIFLIL